MLDNMFKFLYDKVKKSPCKTCLVKATCGNSKPWKRCDEYNKYHNARRKAIETGNMIEFWFLLSIFVCGILWGIFTFFCGLYHQFIYIKGVHF